jgi:3-keto-disaccharide hydrolase
MMVRFALLMLALQTAFAQTDAARRLNTELAPQLGAVTAARNALAAAVFAQPPNPAAIPIMAGAVREAELALAAAASRLQATPEQLAGLNGGGGRGGRGGAVYMTKQQTAAIAQWNSEVAPLMQAAAAARSALLAAGAAEMPAKADALKAAEIALGNARAAAFARLQATAGKLPPDVIGSLIASGGGAGRGGGGGMAFTLPEPLDFNDHEGYVPLFDGVSLKGWDGNPKFWRVEDGAIVGESTPQNPSGNSYIVYRGVEAKDFTLKFEIKVEGTGGSGIQYRSKTGIPWLANIAPNVTANVGPVNLNWMMTGPQADFWPNSAYWTGQVYSENTPMRIMAWRGQVVEAAGMGPKRLMGNIADRDALGKLVRMNDWNQYIVIARGGTLIHIVNGQLMAVLVDDDPASSNNQSGFFGIEIEATTKLYVRNMWLKKLN